MSYAPRVRPEHATRRPSRAVPHPRARRARSPRHGLLRSYAVAHLAALTAHRESDPAHEAAFDRLYRACDPLFRKLANRRSSSCCGADDRVQDLWAAVLVRLRHFDPKRGRFAAWLCQVIRNTLNREDRAGHPWRQLDETSELCVPSREADPATACEASDERAILRAALGQVRPHLSKVTYQIVHARLLESKSYKEIASDHGLTVKQVRKRFDKAAERIEAKLSRLR
jgi:RNA polymerase sigma factor (sigma-70 family)